MPSLKIKPSKRLRIYRRDGWRCQECGVRCIRTTDDSHPKQATLDHIIRREDGGTDGYENLQLLCRPCNYAKEGVGPGLLGSTPAGNVLRHLRAHLPCDR